MELHDLYRVSAFLLSSPEIRLITARNEFKAFNLKWHIKWIFRSWLWVCVCFSFFFLLIVFQVCAIALLCALLTFSFVLFYLLLVTNTHIFLLCWFKKVLKSALLRIITVHFVVQNKRLTRDFESFLRLIHHHEQSSPISIPN